MKYRICRHKERRYSEYDLYWRKEDWGKDRFGLWHKDGELWGMECPKNLDVIKEVDENDVQKEV